MSLVPENQELNDLVVDFIYRISRIDGIVGLCIFGSLAKYRCIDLYSDIDIGVFLEATVDVDCLPPFSFHIDAQKASWEINLSQFYPQRELHKHWTVAQKQAFQDCSILYQEDFVIENLIKSKVNPESERREVLVTNINQIEWRLFRHSVSSFNRGMPESSHLLINEVLQLLIDCVYMLNNRYPPHTKWTFNELNNLGNFPKENIDDFRESILIKSNSWDDISRRIEATKPIYYWVKQQATHIIDNFPTDVYKYWATNYSNRQINNQTFIDSMQEKYVGFFTEDEWRAIGGYIGFYLISSESELLEYLGSKTENNIYVLDINLVNKITRIVHN